MSASYSGALFILGAGILQIPAIRAARELGLRAVVADGNGDAPGLKLADRPLVIDLRATDMLRSEACRLSRIEHIIGVFTAGTDFSLAVAQIAADLGLPGIDVEAAKRATNKAMMRRTLYDKGLPTPRFARIGRRRAPRDLQAAEAIGFPLVVKPADSMGARGVRRVDDADQLRAAVEVAATFATGGETIVEAFIPGQEYSLDALVYRGDIAICGVAERHIRFSPFFVEMGHTMPARLNGQQYRALTESFISAISAIGIDNGAAKGDLFLDGDRAVTGEIAARLSGGFMSGWTYPYASGVDVTKAAIRIAIGDPPGDLTPTRDHVCVERAVISIPGTVENVCGTSAIDTLPEIREYFSRVSSGDTVRFPRNNVEKCATIIASAPRREDAIAAVDRAKRTIWIKLRPDDGATAEFLFGKTGERYPSALTLTDPRNIAAYRSMPSDWPTLFEDQQVAIAAMPAPYAENERDWNGYSLSDILSITERITGARVAQTKPFDGQILARPFWKALLKGGLQGAIAAVEIARANSRHKHMSAIPL